MDEPDPVNARCRQLPAVDRLVREVINRSKLPQWSVVFAARSVVNTSRKAILAGQDPSQDPDLETLIVGCLELAGRLHRPAPTSVLNATGVILHTNLGRAPLAAGAAEAAARTSAGYSDLELDLVSGARGSRMTQIRSLLCQLSGAEDALVVNNGAAALLLAVDSLAAGREVILSRGELIEIGGSFRLPEILDSSRASLREVGTTNRTHLRDYQGALGPESGMLLKVHHSCFEIRGFTHEVGIDELAPLAREHLIPLVDDRGSGTFLDLRSFGIPETPVSQSLADGADVVIFSGDKLLGGPQAGIILGKSEWIERMRTAPLARALRVDKLTLAALDWTLRAVLEERALLEIPVLRMLTRPQAELQGAAEKLAEGLRKLDCGGVEIEQQVSPVGGGSLPEVELEGPVVRFSPRVSPTELARRLRGCAPPLIVRVQQNAIFLDPRTLPDEALDTVVALLSSVVFD